ncbi:MAG: hypothetical protein WCW44_02880 [archaeon]
MPSESEQVGKIEAKVDALNARIERLIAYAGKVRNAARNKRKITTNRFMLARSLRKSNLGRK